MTTDAIMFVDNDNSNGNGNSNANSKMSMLRQQNEFDQPQQMQAYDKVMEKSKDSQPLNEPYFDKSVSHNVTVAEKSTANLNCRPMNTGKKSVSTNCVK